MLGGLALLCLAFGPLTFKNPIWHPVAVGDWYFWNLLALGYLAPALLLGLGAWLLRHFGENNMGAKIAWITAGLSSLLLLFAWSSLELRHAFHGSVMAYGGIGDGEWYAYSLLWLIEAAALLVLGIRLDNKALRHIGMTLLSLVILKVFLSDMAALEGLYRAFSFLGLGASLIGIGYVYQRFLFVPKPTPAGESSSEADESA